MGKIKNKIIRLLGGITCDFCDEFSFFLGCRTAISKTILYADSLYGKDAETWCKEMYKFLQEDLQYIEERMNEVKDDIIQQAD